MFSDDSSLTILSSEIISDLTSSLLEDVHPIKINNKINSMFLTLTLQFTKGYVLSIDFFEFVDEKSVIRLLQILLNFLADLHLVFFLLQYNMQTIGVLLLLTGKTYND